MTKTIDKINSGFNSYYLIITVILIGVIAVISLFIFIFTNIYKKSNLNISNNNKAKKTNILYVVLLVGSIIFIIAFLLLFLLFGSKINERFDNAETNNTNLSIFHGYSFEYGRSGIQPTGTIKFKIPFQKTPKIFTQIVTNSNVSNNIYSVQIFNVTVNSFDYSKNMISSVSTGELSFPKIEKSGLEPFDWVAIG